MITNGRTVPEITPETFEAMRSHINGSGGAEVTGGMLGKVCELLEIGIDLYILNAVRPGMITRFLSGEELGTRITKTENRSA